jgi:NCAIR mutase (PurE)-related protein
MRAETLKRLLDDVAAGRLSPDEAADRLAHLPFEDLGFARLDHHRTLRRGFPEAVYGEGKTGAELQAILSAFKARRTPCIVTRLDAAKARRLRKALGGLRYHERARLAYLGPPPGKGEGLVVVVSGGTSDAPVAQEAALTAGYLGARVESFPDVGVAGLHRLGPVLPSLREARVVVAVAGMEGALPSVVAGLTGALVIGVPTSIGFGVQDQGKTPLFAMLASCVPGLVVVNVDAGFSAGYAAAVVNRLAAKTGARSAKETTGRRDRAAAGLEGSAGG